MEVATRNDRADLVVNDGRAVFTFYKRIDQLLNLNPGDKWFPAPARKALSGD
jgi:hypothetical protein